MGCSAPVGGLSLEGVDVAKETVIQGAVSKDAAPMAGAYVRLLDESGDFTAEVVTSAAGQFRFFAAPGEWRLLALAPGSRGEATVQAAEGQVTEVDLALP